ncbi:MAG: hypothetical protein IJF34_03325 [Clostridia bacterium]|nr:hypothetical protein [Clostridia bacterium]
MPHAASGMGRADEGIGPYSGKIKMFHGRSDLRSPEDGRPYGEEICRVRHHDLVSRLENFRAGEARKKGHMRSITL